MQIIVTIQDFGTIDNIGRIINNMPMFTNRIGWMVAQKEAKFIKRATSRFKNPTGKTASDIFPIKIDEGTYGVTGPDYAWFADKGRGPGRSPPSGPGTKMARYGGNGGYALANHIARHGTRPTNFIETGIANAQSEIIQSLKEHTDYYLKSGGRAVLNIGT